MREFIVWSEQRKEFMDKDGFNDCIGLTLDLEIKNFNDNMEPNGYILFWGIGKTDDTPEKNKIYADSSIVEFEREDRIPTLIDDDVILKFTAFFKYNEYELRYELIILNYDKSKTQHIYSVLSYNMDLMKNLKVIGNLQENSELLKDKR